MVTTCNGREACDERDREPGTADVWNWCTGAKVVTLRTC